MAGKRANHGKPLEILVAFVQVQVDILDEMRVLNIKTY